MRFIIMIAAVVGLMGCERTETTAEEAVLQEAREDLRETQQEAAQAVGETQQEAAQAVGEARQEAAENVAEAREEVGEARQDLNEAARDLARDQADEPRQAQPEADLRRDPPGSPSPDLAPERGDGR